MPKDSGNLFDYPNQKMNYKVVIELYVNAEDCAEAEEKVHEFMREVRLAFADDMGHDMRYPYDITEIEQAEIDFG